MGALQDGKWINNPVASCDKKGNYVRTESQSRHWINKDSEFKPEAGRYHLYVSLACPWAHRAIIMHKLKGLEKIISISVVKPLMLKNGWELDDGKYLYQVYLDNNKDYCGKVTVPVLWDKKLKKIVNNESAEIIRMLNAEFEEFSTNHTDYYPEKLHEKIDKINEFIYHNINNGVYRCGFAKSQEAYNKAFDQLFDALDEIEMRLAKQKFLVGDQITEADIRLFTTLIRFDAVYVGHFKCNKKRIMDYPNLWRYLRELYHYKGIDETVDFDHIKTHYYGSHPDLNPSGIIPRGPELGL